MKKSKKLYLNKAKKRKKLIKLQQEVINTEEIKQNNDKKKSCSYAMILFNILFISLLGLLVCLYFVLV
jgi:hypothetical protein